MTKINYSVLQDLDYVFTTSRGLLSGLIRRHEKGWRAMFDFKVPSHEGRVIVLEKNKTRFVYILEMVVTDDGQAGDLKLRPLSTYTLGGYFDPFIVSIKRAGQWDSIQRKESGVQFALDLWRKGIIKYDWKGCGKNAWFLKWMGGSNSRYYCSEFSEMVDQERGEFSLVGKLLGKKDYAVMPSEHHASYGLREVEGWKIT
jgi:hypothetical protein